MISPRRWPLHLAGCCLFGALLATVLPAQAECEKGAAGIESRKREYARAAQCRKDGDFACARDAFAALVACDAQPELHCNLGEALESLHDYTPALAAFEECRSAGSSTMSEDERQWVAERIAHLQLPATLSVQSNVPETEVLSDEQVLGKTPLLNFRLPLGRHRLLVRRPGYDSAVFDVDAAPGTHEQRAVTLMLSPKSEPPQPKGPTEPKFPVLAWAITSGLGTATLATSIWAGLASANQKERLDTYPTTRESLESGAHQVKVARNISIGLGAATAAMAAVSLWLTFRPTSPTTEHTASSAPRFSLGFTPAQVQARVSF